MIEALDRLTLRASFRDGAIGAYETLFGRRFENGGLRVGNVGVTIEDEASTAQLSSMVFATAAKLTRPFWKRWPRCRRRGTHDNLRREHTAVVQGLD